jgi:hypothetical protein
MAQELHEHQGLVNVARMRLAMVSRRRSSVGEGVGGMGGSWRCGGQCWGGVRDRGWHLLVEHPSPAGYDDPGLLAT